MENILENKISTKHQGYILVIIAGILWSTTGLFAKNLMLRGISTLQVAFIRLFLGAVLLFFYCIIKDKSLLKINKKTFIYCLVMGLICQAGFNTFYFTAVDKVGVSTGAILLYTSPIFLTILSKLVYKEIINAQKIITVVICFVGSVLAVTGGGFKDLNISGIGVMLGILAAISYACMSIISKKALKEANSITILLYSFFMGVLFMIPISKPLEIIAHMKDTTILPYMIGLGTISAAGAYICYIEGICKDIDLSIAGILASGELIGSVILGWIVLKEEFLFIKMVGIILMIVSVVFSILNIEKLKNIFKKEVLEHEVSE